MRNLKTTASFYKLKKLTNYQGLSFPNELSAPLNNMLLRFSSGKDRVTKWKLNELSLPAKHRLLKTASVVLTRLRQTTAQHTIKLKNF